MRFGDSFDVGPLAVRSRDASSSQAAVTDESNVASSQESSQPQSSSPEQETMDDTGPFDPKKDISTFDWQDLESRYQRAMKEHDEKQSAIHDEFRQMMNVCLVS